MGGLDGSRRVSITCNMSFKNKVAEPFYFLFDENFPQRISPSLAATTTEPPSRSLIPFSPSPSPSLSLYYLMEPALRVVSLHVPLLVVNAHPLYAAVPSAMTSNQGPRSLATHTTTAFT